MSAREPAGTRPSSGTGGQRSAGAVKGGDQQVRAQGRRRPLLVVGLVLAILGALAIAAGITAAAAFPVASTARSTGDVGGSRAAVTAPGLLEVREGTATVEARGRGPVTLATAREGDLSAWLRADPPVEAASLGGVDAEGALEVDGVEAAERADVPDASTNDLWLTRDTGDGSASLEVPYGDQPVQVIATAPDGGLQDVSITWPDEATNPWALPLLIGGGVALVVGVVLMLLGRRRSGTADVPAVPAAEGARTERAASPATPPRRGTQRLAALPVLGALVLAGCSSPEPLTPEPRQEPAPQAVLTDAQLENVLRGSGGVVPVVEEADASLDAETAAQRLAGAPLDARSAAYRAATSVREAEGGDPEAAPPVRPLGGEQLLAALPAAGGWPRYAVVVTQPEDQPAPEPAAQPPVEGAPEGEPEAAVEGEPSPEGDSEPGPAPEVPEETPEEPPQPVPVLEVIEQADPRESYKVVARANLLPGAAFPSLAAQGGTVEPVALDAEDLVSPPEQVVADLADVLTAGTDSPHAAGFADSPFINTVLTEQVQQEEGSGRFVDYAAQHAPREGQAWALRTADGGAVLIAVIDGVQSLTPNTEGSTLTLTPTLAAIAGAPTASSQKLTTAETVVVTVPPAGAAAAEGAAERSLEIVGGERDVTAVDLG